MTLAIIFWHGEHAINKGRRSVVHKHCPTTICFRITLIHAACEDTVFEASFATSCNLYGTTTAIVILPIV
jgi:hypothetical protein